MSPIRCIGVAVLASLLAACATRPVATSAPQVLPSAAASSTPAMAQREDPQAAQSPLQSATAMSVARPAPAPDAAANLWARLARGFALDGCAEPGRIAGYAKRYAGWIRRSNWITPMLPQLDYVLSQVEQAGLPAEFALLPIVESEFKPSPSHGNRPAGVWQFMPITARAEGLRIDAGVDQRLDLVASTAAALRHIEALAQRFDRRWQPVVNAYNAGEFRVRRALGGRAGSAARALSPITDSHYAKLLALSCVIAQPSHYALTLPDPDAVSPWRAVRIDARTDLELAALGTGLSKAKLRASNPARRGSAFEPGDHLWLPVANADRLTQVLAKVPRALRGSWGERPFSGDWQGLAAASGMSVAALQAVNGGVENPRRQAAWAPASASSSAHAVDSHRTYVVRRGDSLWTIARRLGIDLAQLKRLNRLERRRILRPGQVLQLP